MELAKRKLLRVLVAKHKAIEITKNFLRSRSLEKEEKFRED